MSLAPGSGMLTVALPGVMAAELDDKCPSPIAEFIADEEAASICPLLTPSPSTPGFDHPLSIISQATNGIPYMQQLHPTGIDNIEIPTLAALSGNAALGYVGLTATHGDHCQDNTEGETQLFDPGSSVQSVVESSSSSSSALHEPTACAQLLGSHHYQHLSKATNNDTFPCQENGGKPALAGIQLAVRKSPNDYCFMSWNWPLIRKVSFWGVISLLVACTCVVIAVIANLPGECNPKHHWWQGNLFYEIFPASFKDSNKDTVGDFNGITSRIQYLESLGVRAVRLNSIFPVSHYPEGYDTPTTLTGIEHVLGTEKDFELLVSTLHQRNMSLVLDLPLHPYFRHLKADREDALGIAVSSDENSTSDENYTDSLRASLLIPPLLQVQEQDSVSKTLEYWLKRGVDGFYLKGLENYTDESNFQSELRRWRKIMDRSTSSERIIMCSIAVVDALVKRRDVFGLQAVLNNVDLVDVLIDLAAANSTLQDVKKQIDRVVSGPLYSGPQHPWVHWRIGGEGIQRLSSRLSINNASLAATLLFALLPGSPSVFYGDEIGLMDVSDPDGENWQDIDHLRHLPPMHWSKLGPDVGFTDHDTLPWLPRSQSWSYIGAGRQSALRDVARLRQATPCIFMDGVWKDDRNVPNYEIRNLGQDMLVLERWYPRRHSYVAVSNLGPAPHVSDLSSHYYGGEIVADMRGRVGEYITFQSLQLFPGECLVIKLDK